MSGKLQQHCPVHRKAKKNSRAESLFLPGFAVMQTGWGGEPGRVILFDNPGQPCPVCVALGADPATIADASQVSGFEPALKQAAGAARWGIEATSKWPRETSRGWAAPACR